MKPKKGNLYKVRVKDKSDFVGFNEYSPNDKDSKPFGMSFPSKEDHEATIMILSTRVIKIPLYWVIKLDGYLVGIKVLYKKQVCFLTIEQEPDCNKDFFDFYSFEKL